MLRTVVAVAVFSVMWVLLSWHFEPLVIVCGVLSVAGTVAITRYLGFMDEELSLIHISEPTRPY